MKFRTEIKIEDAPLKLSPERQLLLAGSCFSDYIGARLEYLGWPAVVNPCGVIYNPVSMSLLLRLALASRAIRREIVASAVTRRDQMFVSWFMSSVVMESTEENCIDRVCARLDLLEKAIEKSEAMILTFGTSDVWLLAGTDRAVGNCHKHPSSEFEKRRIGVEEMVADWVELIKMVRMRNPDIGVILTVSPRRYLAEGFADNSRQKAILLLGCEKLCQEVENTFYFPAYEIMNDDLRDYRFYGKDLVHPSEMAVDYIWEKFTETFMDSSGLSVLKQIETQAKRSAHRKRAGS